MFVFFLIIAFLPLGLTIKGKFLLSFVCFLFALGGLASVVSFPLWQTVLMLGVLIILAAYFLVTRLGTLLLKQTPSFQKEWSKEIINPFSNSKFVFEQGDTSLDLTDLSQSESSFEDNLTPPVLSIQPLDNEQEVEKIESYLLEEDISIFLEKESESEVVELREEEPEVGYLSEIESLIDEEIVEKEEKINRDWLEELDDLLPLDEVAAEKADIEEEKKISLLK